MSQNPVKEASVYKDRNPKGYHNIKVWNSEKNQGNIVFQLVLVVEYCLNVLV